jgi:ribosomal protein S17
MAFEVRFPTAIHDRIRSWDLSPEITREFFQRLLDEFSSPTVLRRLVVTDEGMEFTVTVEETRQRCFTFSLRLFRDVTEDFQVHQCECVCTEDGDVVWSSRSE